MSAKVSKKERKVTEDAAVSVTLQRSESRWTLGHYSVCPKAAVEVN
jgi:hypothetical protein